MAERAPVFVKVDEYKDIADVISLMREKIHQAKDVLDKIADLKAKEDEELAQWAKELEEVEQRVMRIDRTLVEPEM